MLLCFLELSGVSYSYGHIKIRKYLYECESCFEMKAANALLYWHMLKT